MKKREKELLNLIGGLSGDMKIKAGILVSEIVFIEEQMQTIKELPFIEVNPKKASQQRSTPASKLYKELMQQYNNSLRLLFRLSGDIGNDAEEETPLREWLKKAKEKKANEMECR